MLRNGSLGHTQTYMQGQELFFSTMVLIQMMFQLVHISTGNCWIVIGLNATIHSEIYCKTSGNLSYGLYGSQRTHVFCNGWWLNGYVKAMWPRKKAVPMSAICWRVCPNAWHVIIGNPIPLLIYAPELRLLAGTHWLLISWTVQPLNARYVTHVRH